MNLKNVAIPLSLAAIVLNYKMEINHGNTFFEPPKHGGAVEVVSLDEIQVFPTELSGETITFS